MNIKRIVFNSFFVVILNSSLLISNGYSETKNSNTFILKIAPLKLTGLANPSAFIAITNTRVKLEMISQTASPNTPPRQRNPEISEEQLVVIGVNKDGAEIMRSLIYDPRIVRAESVDENGRIISTNFFQNNVEFPVSLPFSPKLFAIEIYHPQWNGERYVLQKQGKLIINE